MKSRTIAFLIHVSLSIVVAVLALLVVFLAWYPAPLNDAIDVTPIFLMLLTVDVFIGPVITFIIYKPQKKTLTVDLLIVVALQITALSYGLYTIYQGRPAFVVFSKDRFEIVRTLDVDPDSLKKALADGNQLASASWLGPQWIASTPPLDNQRRNEILFSSSLGGPDWPQLPELYAPLLEMKSELIEKAKHLDELRAIHNHAHEIEESLKKYDDDYVKWLPLLGISKNMIVLINGHSAEIIKVIDINPWP
jgi:hypothetical protein